VKDNTFNIITSPTHFFASDDAVDITGKSIAEKKHLINRLFVNFPGYQGTSYNSKLRKFFVYFQTLD